MSLTITKDFPHAKKIGKGIYLLSGVIAFSAGYPTGGELLTGISGYFIRLMRVVFDQKSGYLFEFDKTNNKVKVLYPRSAQAVAAAGANQPTVTTGASSASAVDSTTPTVTVPAGFRSAVDAAVGTQVPDTTDLSGLTGVSFIAIGLL